MKEHDGWVKIKKYTDDDGKPVCGACPLWGTHGFFCKGWTENESDCIPGHDCPVWHGESKGEWQPIGTAPKDGTEILGVNDDGIRCVIRWAKHNHVPLYGWIRQVELYGEEVDGFDPVAYVSIPPPPQEKQT